MQELLNRARCVADQAEVYKSQTKQESVSFQASKLKEITSTEEEAWTLRLIKDKKLGAATSTKPGATEVLLQYATNTVSFGSPINYSLPGAAELQAPRTFDPRVTSVSQQEMLDIAGDLVSALNSFDPMVKAMAAVQKATGSRSLLNSAGFLGTTEFTNWTVYFGGELVNDDGFLNVYDGFSGTDYTTETTRLKEKVIESFRLARTVATIKSGQYPVIFTPGEVSCLVNPLLACLNGKAISRGFSPFKDKIGEQAFDSRFSVIDDAQVNGAVGSKSFDREGIATARRTLVTSGRINGYMLDLQTSQELGMSPTGNGSTAGPVANNIIVPGGDASFEQMLASIDEGVLIDGTMGAWAGNPYGGQVSGNISLGYKIEKGKIVGRIKDCMFSVNVFTDLRDNLAALSHDQLWRGNFCFPYIQLNNINISTKS
ncbi:MAG: TldD/PmbA family protein [Peptococcaceae bacterium]|nr:TldD/PmbA family protein [Peptococcaceae bacterium]